MSRTRTITMTLGSLAAGAVLATGVTGLAQADDAASSPSSSSSTSTPPATEPGATGDTSRGAFGDGRHGPGNGHRGGPDGGMRGGMLGGPGGAALHAEAVVKAADGAISTVRMIQGTVTEVSSDSISVKAEDGYTATFAVASTTEIHSGIPTRPADGTTPTAPAAGTIGDVKVGDVAHVEGTVTGSEATASEIHSMTAAEAAQLQEDHAAMQEDHAAMQAG